MTKENGRHINEGNEGNGGEGNESWNHVFAIDGFEYILIDSGFTEPNLAKWSFLRFQNSEKA